MVHERGWLSFHAFLYDERFACGRPSLGWPAEIAIFLKPLAGLWQCLILRWEK
jgi:hypothetical protein